MFQTIISILFISLFCIQSYIIFNIYSTNNSNQGINILKSHRKLLRDDIFDGEELSPMEEEMFKQNEEYLTKIATKAVLEYMNTELRPIVGKILTNLTFEREEDVEDRLRTLEKTKSVLKLVFTNTISHDSAITNITKDIELIQKDMKLLSTAKEIKEFKQTHEKYAKNMNGQFSSKISAVESKVNAAKEKVGKLEKEFKGFDKRFAELKASVNMTSHSSKTEKCTVPTSPENDKFEEKLRKLQNKFDGLNSKVSNLEQQIRSFDGVHMKLQETASKIDTISKTVDILPNAMDIQQKFNQFNRLNRTLIIASQKMNSQVQNIKKLAISNLPRFKELSKESAIHKILANQIYHKIQTPLIKSPQMVAINYILDLISNECPVYIHGGFIRDTVGGNNIHDIDVKYNCPVYEFGVVCNRVFQEYLHRPCKFSHDSYAGLIRVFFNGPYESDYHCIDFTPLNTTGTNYNVDYTVNTALYDKYTNNLYTLNNQALFHLKNKVIKIPNVHIQFNEKDEIIFNKATINWLKSDVKRLSRFWKLRYQKYQTDNKTLKFIVQTTKLILSNELSQVPYENGDITKHLIQGFYVTSCNIVNGQIINNKCLKTGNPEQNYKYQKNATRNEKYIKFGSYSRQSQVRHYFHQVLQDLGKPEIGEVIAPEFEISRKPIWD